MARVKEQCRLISSSLRDVSSWRLNKHVERTAPGCPYCTAIDYDLSGLGTAGMREREPGD